MLVSLHFDGYMSSFGILLLIVSLLHQIFILIASLKVSYVVETSEIVVALLRNFRVELEAVKIVQLERSIRQAKLVIRPLGDDMGYILRLKDGWI